MQKTVVCLVAVAACGKSAPPPVDRPPPASDKPVQASASLDATSASTASKFVGIAAHRDYTCAVRSDGIVRCWGATPGREKDTYEKEVAGLGAVDVATGTGHVCALRRTGTAACWGNGDDGQLGDGKMRTSEYYKDGHFSREAVDVVGVDEIVELAAGDGFSCARRRAGDVVCWGKHPYVSDDKPALKPVAIAELAGAVQIIARSSALCARTSAGAIRCKARVGSVDGADGPYDDFVTSGENGYACGRTAERTVKCWGRPSNGAIGGKFGEPGGRTITGATGVEQLTAAAEHVCVRRGGEVLCWGANYYNQLGEPDRKTVRVRYEAGAVQGLPSSIVDVAAGSRHTCALDRDGAVWCWGTNEWGQCGVEIPADVQGTKNRDPEKALVPTATRARLD